ncbi:hypothetical protein NUW54_g12204 [Trametes sanguinea]|uniref:Uncharacterized protein n=1 Tax=Trametes sanguinea TaxID=158606 RepID=A0ACC1N0Y1_9APHY|nr:hypothetical protein NUW54_g12204 [Trametes sanguinea]
MGCIFRIYSLKLHAYDITVYGSKLGFLTLSSPEIVDIPGCCLMLRRSSSIERMPSAFMRRRRASGGIPEGAILGPRHPDVNLVFVERSIVVDTLRKTAYVQSILPGDGNWLQEMTARLETLLSPPPASSPPEVKAFMASQPAVEVTLPNRAEYISKIKTAKEWLFSGDSYELCVTAPTRISAPRSPSALARGTSSSWELYKMARGEGGEERTDHVVEHRSSEC